MGAFQKQTTTEQAGRHTTEMFQRGQLTGCSFSNPAFSVNKNETTFPVPRPIRWGCNSEKDPTDYRLCTWNSLADVF